MSNSDLVRYSRDGDQFHYLWAARRCLRLLAAGNGLVAISIEGPATNSSSCISPIDSGEELIDIAEYFGSEDITRASLVRVMQLKHSTAQSCEPWTASGLQNTFKGFAEHYKNLLQSYPNLSLVGKLEYWVVTNRPISEKITKTVADVATENSVKYPTDLTKLKKHTRLQGSVFADFCRLLRFEDKQDGYWEQRSILHCETNGYLPDLDIDGPLQLKELVTRKALSESSQNNTITKIDVLKALGVHDEGMLFPAECLIRASGNTISREQEGRIIEKISNATVPVIIHAPGGVGKSICAAHIAEKISRDSICILYDCFGNGTYRNPSTPRHRHKNAFVQIANELASKGLCHPLIPSSNADGPAYIRAFTHRLKQAATKIRARNNQSLLYIFIDAADNAQMAAEEYGETRSFVQDAIRMSIPDGVRLIFLTRTHRQNLLNPPPKALRIELLPFTHVETELFLKKQFPNATTSEIDEFHYLTSQNPRVQAHALSHNEPLDNILRSLGPNPMSVEDTINTLLQDSIAKLKDRSCASDRSSIENICIGLSILRPLVPITILATMSGVEPEAITSFALDIGYPIRVANETLQFIDEPTETWFREQFALTSTKMEDFIVRLKPLANTSSYAASVLPSLLHKAGQIDELVELAMTSAALPEGSPLEKRDIELQRLKFAIMACLKSKYYSNAAKLALKGGGETAGDARQHKLLRENTDLAALFLDLNYIQEIVSRHELKSRWVGSHHLYEAALLSYCADFSGEARSRLRMAFEWLQNWSRQPSDDYEKEKVSYNDIAEFILACLNMDNAEKALFELNRWEPQEISFWAGRIVVRRLIENGRWQDIDALAQAGCNNLHFSLALAFEIRAILKSPPVFLIKNTCAMLLAHKISLGSNVSDAKEPTLNAVVSIVEAALHEKACSKRCLTMLLTRYLPKDPPWYMCYDLGPARITFLRAYCLLAALKGKNVQLVNLAPEKIKAELEKGARHSTSREFIEFQATIGSLLPWTKLLASALIGNIDYNNIENILDETLKLSLQNSYSIYNSGEHINDTIAIFFVQLAHIAGEKCNYILQKFNNWKNNYDLSTKALNTISAICVHTEKTKKLALKCITESYLKTKQARLNAELSALEYIKIARLALPLSVLEARGYFNQASEIISKIGDENLFRWEALVFLADRVSTSKQQFPELAYRFARCAELSRSYLEQDKHFAWDDTTIALCGLCPLSAITILSRWRDRKFGDYKRLLPVALKNLIDRGMLSPLDTLPFVGFHADWKYDVLLQAILMQSIGIEEKRHISTILWRYAQLAGLAPGALQNIQNIAEAHGFFLEEIVTATEITKRDDEERAHRNDTESLSRKEIIWNNIFTGKDPSTKVGLSQIFSLVKKTQHIYIGKEFFHELVSRVPSGREADFIDLLFYMPEFSIYYLKEFLQIIPESWKGRPAITMLLAQNLKKICINNCTQISKSKDYQNFPFELASSLSGVSEDEFVQTILDSIHSEISWLENTNFFNLAGFISEKLSAQEAIDVLDYGLTLFHPVLEEKDGDGSWKESLKPPTDIHEALAGYIWAALADPEAATRWDAAHAVFESCQMGRHGIIAQLANLAATGKGEPFVDATLPFYKYHALQWLLIGFARAAATIPDAVAPHGTLLVEIALTHEHVAIREFAARGAVQLILQGRLPNDDELLIRLRSVNISPFKPKKRNNLPRAHGQCGRPLNSYSFGVDIGPYWYAPLGKIFDLSRHQIEDTAEKIIRETFNYTGKNIWDNDERARRKFYGYRECSHSHGSYPRTDDLQFYLSYHAMMFAAGRLLATKQTIKPYSEIKDSFADWFSGHDINRKDGCWLWERRDLEPCKKPTWLMRNKEPAAYYLVTQQDFDEVLWTDEFLNVWGSWIDADNNDAQSTYISSALVSPQKSEALLRALATTKNSSDYAIPSAGHDLEIYTQGFRLQGWVHDYSKSYGLDTKDRWAGGISYPPPRPAHFIAKLMCINCDEHRRIWVDSDGLTVMKSQVWGYHNDETPYDENPNGGMRLHASTSFIKGMLQKTQKNLIIEVQISRNRRSRSHEKSWSYDDDYKLSAKLYLIRQDGCILTI